MRISDWSSDVCSSDLPDDALAAEAKNLAAFYAAGAPLALSAAKRLLWNTIEVERALPEEARTVSSLSATADSREGLAAVIEKRKPVYHGRRGCAGRWSRGELMALVRRPSGG